MARKPLSKRTRFEVFKRDAFTCQYCGRTPPDVVLHCDHIEPVAEGGGDEITNLVTACIDCNLGKSDVPLSVVPESLAERAERIAEAEEQLAAYRALMREVEERREAEAWEIIRALYDASETTNSRYQSVRMFLRKLPVEEILEAARLARGAVQYSDPRRFKYFCAVCWNRIRDAE